MTLSFQRLETLPAEGEIGVVERAVRAPPGVQTCITHRKE
jgi:hypothetical protein